MTKSVVAALLVWWVACSGTAVWGLWGAPLVFVVVALVAAAVFTVVLLRCEAHRTSVRLVVYVTAVLANQGPAITSGLWPLLPGHHQHKVTATGLGLLWTTAAAVVAVATFLLVRAWVDTGRRRQHVPRRHLRRWQVTGVGACAAAIYFLVFQIADTAWEGGQDLFGITPTHFPTAGGGFGAWALETATGGLAGAVEEPVFVGLLVLLWPALRARTFIPLALLSGVARASIHLYYAAGTAHVGVAVALIVLWCAAWSSASLLLIYRTRMLWPVIVAHGFNNYVATLNGPFTADVTPLHVAAVGAPMITILAIGGVAIIYGVPRVVDSLSGAIIRRWPNLDRTSQAADT